MPCLGPNMSITTLTVNALNTLIKGQRMPEWIKNQEPIILWETHFKRNDIGQKQKMEQRTSIFLKQEGLY